MQVRLIPITLPEKDAKIYPETVDEILEYIRCLNDQDVNKYLEIRFIPQTYDTVKKYIESLPDNVRFFKIISLPVITKPVDVNKQGLPINSWVGNIKLGPINQWHKFAEIGILIFPKYWSNGYGSKAIALITNYAFDVLHLHKVYAGCLEPNIASIKAFTKAGFTEEYRIKNQYIINGNGYVDDIVLSKINTQFEGYTKWNIAKDVLCQTQDQVQDLPIVHVYVKPASIMTKEKVLTGTKN